MSNIKRLPIDRAVHFVPAADPSDPRVLTAEELALAQEISALSLKSPDSLLFKAPPEISIFQDILLIRGELHSEVYANQSLAIDTGVRIADKVWGSQTKVREYFYLMSAIAVVGAEQDADLGNFSRQYNGQVVSGYENTQRLRCFWFILSSYSPLTVDLIKNAIAIVPTPDNAHSPMGEIEVVDETITYKYGFVVGGIRFYPTDENLVSSKYKFLLDSLELTPIARLNQYKNHLEKGYFWDEQPHVPFEEMSILARTTRPPAIKDILHGLLVGKPLPGKNVSRSVLNAILGATDSSSTPHPGMTSVSPNNSKVVANDQRIFFCNQARTERNLVQHLTADSDRDGFPVVTATLNTENPVGTRFSANQDDHRLYSADGVLQNQFGSFSDLGGTQSLSWYGNQNTTIASGDRVIFAPGIEFPAGSGFSLPFWRVAKVYYNGVQLHPSNVLDGFGRDLSQYYAPANEEDFIVIWGAERAALHYIYKKITITTNNNGVAIVPDTEKGCLAFIEGVTGRIDAPVYSGLDGNRQYNCLVYYPPRSSGEVWQFEVEYTPYQGAGEDGLSLLNGATIASDPVNYVHVLGGGLSVHRGDSLLSRSIAAFHLPKHDAQYPCYKLDNPIRLRNESYTNPNTFREINLLHGRELAMPRVGQKITATVLGEHFPQSLNIALSVGDSVPMGYSSPAMYNQAAFFQFVCAFLVSNQGRTGLVVITHNQKGGENLPIAVNKGAAIDVFLVDL